MSITSGMDVEIVMINLNNRKRLYTRQPTRRDAETICRLASRDRRDTSEMWIDALASAVSDYEESILLKAPRKQQKSGLA